MNEQIKQEVLNLIQNASAKAPEVLSQACNAQVVRLTGDAVIAGMFFLIVGPITVWSIRNILRLAKERDLDTERGFGFLLGAVFGVIITGCTLAETAYSVVALVSWKLNPYGELLLKLIGDAS